MEQCGESLHGYLGTLYYFIILYIYILYNHVPLNGKYMHIELFFILKVFKGGHEMMAVNWMMIFPAWGKVITFFGMHSTGKEHCSVGYQPLFQ
jgi:hypothetical protein